MTRLARDESGQIIQAVTPVSTQEVTDTFTTTISGTVVRLYSVDGCTYGINTTAHCPLPAGGVEYVKLPDVDVVVDVVGTCNVSECK